MVNRDQNRGQNRDTVTGALRDISSLSLKDILLYTGPDPEHLNTEGHRMPRHDVRGLICKGGEYERGSPPSDIGGPGFFPGKIWEIVVPEKRF